MTIDGIKGYRIVTVSKKKADKFEISNELAEIVSEEELRSQIKYALTNGGKVYALGRKNKLYACSVFSKTECAANEFIEEDKAAKLKKKILGVYELDHQYFSRTVENGKDEAKKAFLAYLKETAEINGCRVIIDMNRIYIHKSVTNSAVYNSMVVIALAFLIFSMLNVMSLGISVIMLCALCAPGSWSEVKKRRESEKGLTECH